MVNYRVKDDMYIVDRLFDRAQRVGVIICMFFS
jgi:hypothetical protein